MGLSSSLYLKDLRILLFTLFISLIVIISISYVFNYFFDFEKVRGNSMYPYLKEGDIVFLLKRTFYKKGDVIVFSLPNDKKFNHDTHLIKRISFIFNQDEYTSFIDKGKPYRMNFFSLFIEKIKIIFFNKFSVVREKFFVTGDNPHQSYDSANFGFIDDTYVYGKVIYIFS